jgi:hypothetical protein
MQKGRRESRGELENFSFILIYFTERATNFFLIIDFLSPRSTFHSEGCCLTNFTTSTRHELCKNFPQEDKIANFKGGV